MFVKIESAEVLWNVSLQTDYCKKDPRIMTQYVIGLVTQHNGDNGGGLTGRILSDR